MFTKFPVNVKIAKCKKEHEVKVHLTKRENEDRNIELAEVRIEKEDGGLAKHSAQYSQGIEL